MAQALARRDLGAVVRVFRKWTGASQTDVGALVGMPQPHISELERGGRRITSLDLFERFADGLGIPRNLLGLADGDSDHLAPSAGVGMNYRSGEKNEQVLLSHREWVNTRRNLNKTRAILTQLVSNLYPPAMRL